MSDLTVAEQGAVTWSELTASCGDCGWGIRVSNEFLAFQRAEDPEDMTDVELAGCIDVCLQCSGTAVAGERLDIGEQPRAARGRAWADAFTRVLATGALVYQAGGHMGGDCDVDGLPVVDGRWYVAAQGFIYHPGSSDFEWQTVSRGFESAVAAAEWAKAQGFARVVMDLGEEGLWEAGDPPSPVSAELPPFVRGFLDDMADARALGRPCPTKDVNGGDFIEWLSNTMPGLWEDLRDQFIARHD